MVSSWMYWSPDYLQAVEINCGVVILAQTGYRCCIVIIFGIRYIGPADPKDVSLRGLSAPAIQGKNSLGEAVGLILEV